MFGNEPLQMRELGSLNIQVGDLVEMNPSAMLNGGGLAIITQKEGDGVFQIRYVKNGYETVADDMIDILRVVNK